MSDGFDITRYGFDDDATARQRLVGVLEDHGCCIDDGWGEQFVQAVLEEQNTALVDALLDQAVKAYRMRDDLINDADRAVEQWYVSGEAIGLRAALCLVKGWDPNADGDKEGRADELIIEHWQAKHPEEWT